MRRPGAARLRRGARLDSVVGAVQTRALGSSVATMLNWTCSFVVTETFDYVRLALGPAGTFLGFCAVCVAGFVFVAACVPETKGKSLEEIQALFQR